MTLSPPLLSSSVLVVPVPPTGAKPAARPRRKVHDDNGKRAPDIPTLPPQRERVEKCTAQLAIQGTGEEVTSTLAKWAMVDRIDPPRRHSALPQLRVEERSPLHPLTFKPKGHDTPHQPLAIDLGPPPESVLPRTAQPDAPPPDPPLPVVPVALVGAVMSVVSSRKLREAVLDGGVQVKNTVPARRRFEPFVVSSTPAVVLPRSELVQQWRSVWRGTNAVAAMREMKGVSWKVEEPLPVATVRTPMRGVGCHRPFNTPHLQLHVQV
eukprot:Sspe_Gene.105019::Locus_82056_Transcript_1_1_Confidence_1.000_Length_971::g.105019::m.105019